MLIEVTKPTGEDVLINPAEIMKVRTVKAFEPGTDDKEPELETWGLFAVTWTAGKSDNFIFPGTQVQFQNYLNGPEDLTRTAWVKIAESLLKATSPRMLVNLDRPQ